MIYNKRYEQASSSGGIKQSESQSHEAPKKIPQHVLRNIEKSVRTDNPDPKKHPKK
jgi:hypothetical protein